MAIGGIHEIYGFVTLFPPPGVRLPTDFDAKWLIRRRFTGFTQGCAFAVKIETYFFNRLLGSENCQNLALLGWDSAKFSLNFTFTLAISRANTVLSLILHWSHVGCHSE